MRPFRFGIVCAAATAAQLHEVAREAEGRGYSTLALTDHLDLSGAHVARLSWLPALASAAAVTSTLRFTTMVANQDLRHPAVLAREVASLDILSSGRMELGLGAGWNPIEYDWAGITLDPAAVRVRRLAEYAQVISLLLDATTETVSFTGEFFTITAMPTAPHPTQRHVPLMLGGAQRTMLSTAGRLADIVNILTLRESGTTDEVMAQKVPWIREAAGSRDVELGTSVVLVATDATDPADAVRAALPRSRFARHVTETQSVESVAAAPHVLAGSPEAIAEELVRRRERWGLSYYLIPEDAMTAFQPVLEALV